MYISGSLQYFMNYGDPKITSEKTFDSNTSKKTIKHSILENLL